LGTRQTDFYVLPVPFSHDTNMVDYAHPNDVLSVWINGTRLPDISHILTNNAGDDVYLDLHVQPVEFVSSSTHGGSLLNYTNVYPIGATISVTAPTMLIGESRVRYRLTAFSGTGSVSGTGATNSLQFCITNDSSIRWLWETEYELAASPAPAHGGVIKLTPSSSDGYYPSGTQITMAACPTNGYVFSEWGGDLSGTSSNRVLLMSSGRSVSAEFERDADSDAMGDDWELLYFGSAHASNALAEADVDLDGMVNYAEYVAGTDPLDGQSVFRISSIDPSNGSALLLAWSSTTNRTYRVLSSSNLTNWVQLPDESTVYSGVVPQLQVLVTNQPTSPLFIRIEVSR